MSTSSEPLDLARWFPHANAASDEDRWIALAEKALRGKPLAKLTRSVAEGVSLAPIAHDLRGAATPAGRSGPWQIRQEIATPDQAIEAIAGGVEALWLRAGPIDRLEAVLAQVGDRVELLVDADGAALEWLGRMRGARGGVLIDPIARPGSDYAELIEALRQAPAGLRVVGLSGLPVANAGGDAVQELAFILASLMETAREADAAGLGLGDWLPRAEVRVSLGRELLVDIALLRALRRVASRLLAYLGAAPVLPRIHAVLPQAALSVRDPWTNLLRSTQAGFAGAVGGADALSLPAHDAAHGGTSAQGQRIARNLQLLLREESHLDRVDDPAAGSATVESLTDALARQAWTELQAHESAGGLRAVLQSGTLSARIGLQVAAREARLRTRKEVRVGVSRYPDTGAAVPRPTASSSAGPLPVWRPSSGWEGLAASVHASGASVFLAKIGPIARHTARAGFARDLFASGGFGVAEGRDHDDPDQAAIEFGTSGCRVACICGSDDDYERLATGLARQLHAAGATAVLVAGPWPSEPGPWKEAGINDVVYLGADVHTTLSRLAGQLGIEVTA